MGDLVLDLILRFVFLPVFLLISTPYVVVSSLHGEGSYLERMRWKYARVYEFWRDHWERED